MEIPKTELSQWRLDVDAGVHRWRYVDQEEAKRRPQSTAEKYFLGLLTVIWTIAFVL
jgi:hypothetical protein